MGRPGLSRRQLLGTAGGLAVAASFGFAAVEGASILHHGRYYYLFASYDACCAGVNSTYKIRAGRSTTVTGPYVDSTGTPMLEGGGDLLLASHGRYIGPGGESTFHTHGKTWLAYHYYDAEDNGTPKLGLNPLGWTKNGWPKPT
ncbi:family 43 glycosylhydrolase [Streptomyces sp. NPDC001714]|uniref:family 43 glycosylhydrolase n=1 Tax=Streptomyces sp. NPDC001714 TaxID=3364603 RepID=UPI0036AB8300